MKSKTQRHEATLKDVGEAWFIRACMRLFKKKQRYVALGVGDDAAVVQCKEQHMVVSCDMLVEGEDFDGAYTSWKDVGVKAASVNLSDLAAMGATPRALCVAVAVSENTCANNVLQMLQALHKQGLSFGAPVVGGDVSRTQGPCVVTVTAMGVCESRTLQRHKAQVGDVVMVGGVLGASACGMAVLQKKVVLKKGTQFLVQQHLRPQPQVALGQFLAREQGVTSCVDVSDGLAKEALLLPAHGGVQLNPQALPIPKEVEKVCALLGKDPIETALTGGEDFVLACTVKPHCVETLLKQAQQKNLFLQPVGHVVEKKGLWLEGHSKRYRGKAFEHFQKG